MTFTNETIAKIIQLCENNSKLSKKDQENWWKTASTEERRNRKCDHRRISYDISWCCGEKRDSA